MPHRDGSRMVRRHRCTAGGTVNGMNTNAHSATAGSRGWAVLVDAENISRRHLPAVMAATNRWGHSPVRRAYGDWNNPFMNRWRIAAAEHGFRRMQQTSYTAGKNAVDMAMCIDAIDLWHRRGPAGFVLVSSDADFTPLVERLRREGVPVHGLGEEKTPAPLRRTCTTFTTLKAFRPQQQQQPVVDLQEVAGVLRAAVAAASTGDGWANLSDVGVRLARDLPRSRWRQLGARNLHALLDMCGGFTVEPRVLHPGHGPSLCVCCPAAA